MHGAVTPIAAAMGKQVPLRGETWAKLTRSRTGPPYGGQTRSAPRLHPSRGRDGRRGSSLRGGEAQSEPRAPDRARVGVFIFL